MTIDHHVQFERMQIFKEVDLAKDTLTPHTRFTRGVVVHFKFYLRNSVNIYCPAYPRLSLDLESSLFTFNSRYQTLIRDVSGIGQSYRGPLTKVCTIEVLSFTKTVLSFIISGSNRYCSAHRDTAPFIKSATSQRPVSSRVGPPPGFVTHSEHIHTATTGHRTRKDPQG